MNTLRQSLPIVLIVFHLFGLYACSSSSDGEPPIDSSVMDGSSGDSGRSSDSGTVDSGTVDSGTVDSGTVDSGAGDTDSGVDAGSGCDADGVILALGEARCIAGFEFARCDPEGVVRGFCELGTQCFHPAPGTANCECADLADGYCPTTISCPSDPDCT